MEGRNLNCHHVISYVVYKTTKMTVPLGLAGILRKKLPCYTLRGMEEKENGSTQGRGAI